MFKRKHPKDVITELIPNTGFERQYEPPHGIYTSDPTIQAGDVCAPLSVWRAMYAALLLQDDHGSTQMAHAIRHAVEQAGFAILIAG